jgi:hypothetical protein
MTAALIAVMVALATPVTGSPPVTIGFARLPSTGTRRRGRTRSSSTRPCAAGSVAPSTTSIRTPSASPRRCQCSCMRRPRRAVPRGQTLRLQRSKQMVRTRRRVPCSESATEGSTIASLFDPDDRGHDTPAWREDRGGGLALRRSMLGAVLGLRRSNLADPVGLNDAVVVVAARLDESDGVCVRVDNPIASVKDRRPHFGRRF